MPAAAATERVVLGETNVLTGEQTRHVAVTLPRAATLDLTPSRSSASAASQPAAMSTEGGSGYVGFLLTEAGSTDGFMALALRTPEPLPGDGGPAAATGYAVPARDDRADPPLSAVTGEAPTCTICNVPAGDYDLYLITGGEATSVTVTLRGLSGEVRIAPDGRTFSFQSTDRPPVEGPSQPSPLGAGGSMTAWTFPLFGDIDQPGLLIDSYLLTVAARNQMPAAVTTARDCRNTGDSDACDDHVLAGSDESVGGLVVTQGRFTKAGVRLSFSWDITGDARYRLRHDYLWLSAGSDTSATQQDLRLRHRAVMDVS